MDEYGGKVSLVILTRSPLTCRGEEIRAELQELAQRIWNLTDCELRTEEDLQGEEKVEKALNHG